MKRRILLICCLIALTSPSSVAFIASVAFAQSSVRPVFHPAQQSFQSQIYSGAPLEIARGSDSARLKSELYAVNPFDPADYDHKFYNKVVDSLIRIRSILENEETSRKLKISTNNTNISSTTALERHIALLSEGVEKERAAALLDRVELTKRQIVFSANQLKDDLAAVLVYPSSRSASSESRPSAASSALRLAFTKKIDALSTQVVKDCLALDSQYQVRLGSIVSSGEGLKKQMNSTVGSNKVSGNGTTMYVRNYVNFGGVDQSPSSLIVPAAAPPASLLAVPGRLAPPTGRRQLRSRP